VQGLVTAVSPNGLNLQVLGFFDGTIDQLHLDQAPVNYKLGKKVKARILYDYSSSPPKFALALADHIVHLSPRFGTEHSEEDKGKTVQEIYPLGTLLEAVKVVQLEAERGLIVEIAPGIRGFVHVLFIFLCCMDIHTHRINLDFTHFRRTCCIPDNFWSLESRVFSSRACYWIFPV